MSIPDGVIHTCLCLAILCSSNIFLNAVILAQPVKRDWLHGPWSLLLFFFIIFISWAHYRWRVSKSHSCKFWLALILLTPWSKRDMIFIQGLHSLPCSSQKTEPGRDFLRLWLTSAAWPKTARVSTDTFMMDRVWKLFLKLFNGCLYGEIGWQMQNSTSFIICITNTSKYSLHSAYLQKPWNKSSVLCFVLPLPKVEALLLPMPMVNYRTDISSHTYFSVFVIPFHPSLFIKGKEELATK